MLVMGMSSKKHQIPAIRFKGFTDAWEQRKLGEHVTIKSGWSPSNFVRTNSEGSELFIKVDDLNYSSREQNDSQMRVYDNPRFQKMKKGSTIFPKRGAAIMTNKVRILSSDAYMDTNMMALEPQVFVAIFCTHLLIVRACTKSLTHQQFLKLTINTSNHILFIALALKNRLKLAQFLKS